ncbi:MAG: hypothetical protein DDT19_02854 [Syntrophomonadaceae bacterium]|nr:hypothetical protein [Bacillota bacterium]
MSRVPRGVVDVLNRDAAAVWSITVTVDNAAAIATRIGISGQNHYITCIAGSFGVALIRLMTLIDGTTIIGNFHVHNQRDIVFAKPLRLTAGNTAELRLAASGTAGVFGAVTMSGYTA